jgi:integrase/recombinase XerD
MPEEIAMSQLIDGNVFQAVCGSWFKCWVWAKVLDAWLDARKDTATPLFITRTGRRMYRGEAAEAVRRIAAQANGRLAKEEKIDVSPHVLRHTFLRKLAETKGVHYAREASGHQSDRYIWRYVKPDQQTLADAIDELE